MGVFQAADRLMDQVDHPRRVDRTPDLHQFAERLTLDELHREVAGAILLAHVLDGDDVGMPQQPAHLSFVLERAALLGIVRKSIPQHLDGQHGAGVAVDRPIDPGEGARPDLIQDLRPAVAVAATLSPEQPLELEAGEQFPPDERLAKRLGIQRMATRLGEGLVERGGRHELEVGHEVQQVVGRRRLHETTELTGNDGVGGPEHRRSIHPHETTDRRILRPHRPFPPSHLEPAVHGLLEATLLLLFGSPWPCPFPHPSRPRFPPAAPAASASGWRSLPL